MRAYHDKIAMNVARRESAVLRLPASPQVTGIWGAVLQRARAVMWHSRPPRACVSPSGLDFVHSLDDHMLTDIGLQADAVWRDMPRTAWPH
jgi:hypothetical protein